MPPSFHPLPPIEHLIIKNTYSHRPAFLLRDDYLVFLKSSFLFSCFSFLFFFSFLFATHITFTWTDMSICLSLQHIQCLGGLQFCQHHLCLCLVRLHLMLADEKVHSPYFFGSTCKLSFCPFIFLWAATLHFLHLSSLTGSSSSCYKVLAAALYFLTVMNSGYSSD